MTSESELWNFQDVKKLTKMLKVDSEIVCLKDNNCSASSFIL